MALNTHLFVHELKSLRRSTIIWTIGLSSLSVGLLCLFPLFANDISSTREIFDKFPPAFKELFNIAVDRLATVVGFFSYLFNFLLLAGSIQALNVGLRALSKEESDKTVDFLLTKPLSRTDVVAAKSLAAFSSLVIFNSVFTVASLATALAVSNSAFDKSTFLLITGSLFLVQLIFLALGFLLSAMLKRVKSVISLSMPIVFAFFIMGALGSAVGDVDISHLTPFKFFDTTYILDHSTYNISYVILTAILITIATTFTYVLYRKRDIHSV